MRRIRSSLTVDARAWAASLLWLAVGLAAAAEPRVVPHGRLETLNGYTVVSVEGTPEQMGTAYGTLLKPLIQRVVQDVVADDVLGDPGRRAEILRASRLMARFQPKAYLAELRAMAKAAEVPYDQLVLLQFFGDVQRAMPVRGGAQFCTSFAMVPPLTRGRRCLVGRNFDYFYSGVAEYASILACYRPKGRIAFVTVTWAGVINGWTLLSERGIVASNNTAYGIHDSLEGISTCFLLRHVVEQAKTVDEGVALVRKGPRACGTALLIASGDPPDAALVEFDHRRIAVRRPRDGFVGADNSFLRLYRGTEQEPSEWSRIAKARALALAARGKLDFSTNLAGAPGVPLRGINLHSTVLDATALRLKVAMGDTPACEQPYRAFRLTRKGLVADPQANDTPEPGEARDEELE
ncbi:MAG: C45 family autoproteolytic acyltransferase/hydrolase [Planctomycetota bacterium]